jgi:ATP-dependent DNA helicase RecG
MAESQNTEWKESWRDEYLKWICGFANAHGGTLWIGKNDCGTVVGVSDSKKLLSDIPNKIRDALGVIADVNLHNEAGKDFLEIVVRPSSFPVSYKGEYHYRSGSTKQHLTGQALTQFIHEKTGRHWDGFPVDNIAVSDLRHDSFDIFREQSARSGRMVEKSLGLSNTELLESLKLLTADGKLTRAGVLLFHHDPEKLVPGAYVKIGYFEKGADIRFMDEIRGSLVSQAEKIVDTLFLKYLKADISYRGVTRVETYPYPKEAIREAIYNAVAHKAYHEQIPIQIRVQTDENRIYISNDAILPPGWTADTFMRHHRSVPYNPNIANAFFRAGFIEAWGRGIEKICESCTLHGIPLPEYDIGRFEVTVMFKGLPVSPASSESEPLKHRQNIAKTSPSDVLAESETKIIALMETNPRITQAELCETLSLSMRQVQKSIRILIEKGEIRRIGGKRYGYWAVK